MAGKKRRGGDIIVGRLKAADPFELIRWLARSQPDPRKALAELVQNSIDAQACNIRITRMRERGVAMLRIVDDGEGVIPELPRREALQHIATHVGHSRKRNLTPEQRRELMLQGQTRVECLGERRLRAELRDALGTRILRAVRIDWECAPGLGAVESCGGRVALFRAGAEPGTAAVIATAEEGGQVARGEASVEIVEQLGGSPSQRAGIPEPIFVDEGASSWRSRMVDGRWEVNSGHPDFQAASESSKRKVRYLTALLGKEIVLHSFPAPQLGAALERLVGVLTITERRLERG